MQKLKALIQLAKPPQWTKTFGNMLLGSLAALWLANAAIFSAENIYLFALGFISAGALLWGGSYALNDWTDRKQDALHPVKKNRPIPSGKVSEEAALAFALSLIAAGLAIALTINVFFFICFAAMLLNQLAYTFKPLRLKERPVLDLVSGSMIAPFFRFYSGWTLFAQNFSAPITIVVFVVLLQLAGFTLYRLGTKEHEEKLKYKSSVVVFEEKHLKAISYAAGAIAFIALLAAIFFRHLPILTLALIVASFAAVPSYAKAVLKPTEMDLKKMYWMLYWHNFLFSLGLIAVFAFS